MVMCGFYFDPSEFVGTLRIIKEDGFAVNYCPFWLALAQWIVRLILGE